jgi:hypothetical protein
MIGRVIAVGQHLGRWMYVTEIDEATVYGRVWSPLHGRWSVGRAWYPVEAIDQKAPACPKPAPPRQD